MGLPEKQNKEEHIYILPDFEAKYCLIDVRLIL